MFRRFVTAMAAVIGLAASGCMLPDYYTPGGYSSTSSQRLQESTIDWSDGPSGKTRQSIGN